MKNDHELSAEEQLVASNALPRGNEISLPGAKPARRSATGFTRASVARMHCPQGQSEKLFWDKSCLGFGLRALKSGRRSWIYQYRDEHKRTRRIVLGSASSVGLDAARKAARQHAASVAQGANPSVDRKAKRTAPSVLNIVNDYLEQARARQRPRSFQETERHLRRHSAPLHHERIESVGRRDISALLERVCKESGPIAANRLRAALSAMWSWGLRTGRIHGDSNPVSFTYKQPEKRRERTLSDAEIRAIWAATEDGSDYARIVRLCLLTGCRRQEIGGLRWSEVREDRIMIAAQRMKGGLVHEVPLTTMMAATLPECTADPETCVFGRLHTGFSGWSRGKAALDAKVAAAGTIMPPWSLHDMRRTFSTKLHDTGIEPIVVEALLSHKQHGVAAVYNRASFREAKRAALARWQSMIGAILKKPRRG